MIPKVCFKRVQRFSVFDFNIEAVLEVYRSVGECSLVCCGPEQRNMKALALAGFSSMNIRLFTKLVA